MDPSTLPNIQTFYINLEDKSEKHLIKNKREKREKPKKNRYSYNRHYVGEGYSRKITQVEPDTVPYKHGDTKQC